MSVIGDALRATRTDERPLVVVPAGASWSTLCKIAAHDTALLDVLTDACFAHFTDSLHAERRAQTDARAAATIARKRCRDTSSPSRRDSDATRKEAQCPTPS